MDKEDLKLAQISISEDLELKIDILGELLDKGTEEEAEEIKKTADKLGRLLVKAMIISPVTGVDEEDIDLILDNLFS